MIVVHFSAIFKKVHITACFIVFCVFFLNSSFLFDSYVIRFYIYIYIYIYIYVYTYISFYV